jgi:uncharacterized protein YsxB (DUF464 family)
VPVRVVFSCDSDGVASFRAEGHTGFAEKGSDIVCSAVSAVIHTLAAGAEKVIDSQGFVMEARDGFFEVSCRKGLSKDSRKGFDVLAMSVIETLRQIEQEHPGSCSIVKASNFNALIDSSISIKD